MKLPFKSKKRSTERTVYFLDKYPDGERIPLAFKSINKQTVEEIAFIDDQKSMAGRYSPEIGAAIAKTAEAVAEQTGRDQGEIASALVQYRESLTFDSGSKSELGYIGMHAPRELADFREKLEKAVLHEQNVTIMTVMQRASKCPELDFDPEKWTIENSDDLDRDSNYPFQLEAFFIMEGRGDTDRHLKPIEGEENAYLFTYSRFNVEPDPEPTVKEKEQSEAAQEKKVKVAVGKS